MVRAYGVKYQSQAGQLAHAAIAAIAVPNTQNAANAHHKPLVALLTLGNNLDNGAFLPKPLREIPHYPSNPHHERLQRWFKKHHTSVAQIAVGVLAICNVAKRFALDIRAHTHAQALQGAVSIGTSRLHRGQGGHGDSGQGIGNRGLGTGDLGQGIPHTPHPLVPLFTAPVYVQLYQYSCTHVCVVLCVQGVQLVCCVS